LRRRAMRLSVSSRVTGVWRDNLDENGFPP
jgi:hypothetical protein